MTHDDEPLAGILGQVLSLTARLQLQKRTHTPKHTIAPSPHNRIDRLTTASINILHPHTPFTNTQQDRSIVSSSHNSTHYQSPPTYTQTYTYVHDPHRQLGLDLQALDRLRPVLPPPLHPRLPELEGLLHVQLPGEEEAAQHALGRVPVCVRGLCVGVGGWRIGKGA